MKKQLFITVLLVFFHILGHGQRAIPMEKVKGTYQIPCKVNGIPLKFIFDTGASDVSISSTEALFLLKQGLLSEEDFREEVEYQIANGDVVKGTIVNLREIDIDGVILNNIQASVLDNLVAPLLLGQSAIEKLGRFSLEKNNLILIDYPPKERTVQVKSNIEKRTMDKEALEFINSFLNNKSWAMESTGELKYNSYSSSFDFKSEKLISNPMTEEKSTELNVSYSFTASNIKGVTEVIKLKNPNKYGDSNVLFYEISFHDPIKYNFLKLKPGEIPEQKTSSREKVSLSLEKQLEINDINNLKRAFRAIFPNVNISTKNL